MQKLSEQTTHLNNSSLRFYEILVKYSWQSRTKITYIIKLGIDYEEKL